VPAGVWMGGRPSGADHDWSLFSCTMSPGFLPSDYEGGDADALTAEFDLLVIQGDVVSAEHVSSSTEPLNLKTFIRELDTPVLVGGCGSHAAALHLMRTGAAGVLVGVDRPDLGVGVPLATALADARSARVLHLDETGVYCHVIAVDRIGDGADVAKAVVCGADAVMVDAGVVVGADAVDLAGPLRRAMATCGYTDLKSFQKAELVVRAAAVGGPP